MVIGCVNVNAFIYEEIFYVGNAHIGCIERKDM